MNIGDLKPKDKEKVTIQPDIFVFTLAPIKGRLCGAKRGGDNNYSPKKGTPDLGGGKKKDPSKSPHYTAVKSYQKTREFIKLCFVRSGCPSVRLPWNQHIPDNTILSSVDYYPPLFRLCAFGIICRPTNNLIYRNPSSFGIFPCIIITPK